MIPKRLTRLLTLATLMASSVTAISGECGDFPVAFFKTTQHNQHQEWGITIPRAVMASQPEWTAGKVPLTINQARDIVTSWAKDALAKYDSIAVTGYHLHPYDCPSLPNRWFYIVNVTPQMDGHKIPDAALSVGVTFSGDIVEAAHFKH